MEMKKIPSQRSIGAVRNMFIVAMLISSLSTIILITTLPIMLFRLDVLYEQISIEKLAFHRAANSLDEEIEFLLQPTSMRKQRLVRQVDFLTRLERKSFKGRMRMISKTTEGDSLPSAQFDKYVQPSLNVFDRQIPHHTSQMRAHILDQLRSLSPGTQIHVQKSMINQGNVAQLKYDERCPRGSKGKRGRDGEIGLRGVDGIDGINGVSAIRYGHKGNCIICPIGIQGVKGMPGRVGMPGIVGKSAYQPNQGPQGQTGDVGLPGDNGVEGTRGLDGENAIRFTQGPQGSIGVPGDEGQIGDFGLDGVDCEYAQVGDQGDVGIEGMRGKDGIDGIDGEIRDNGQTGDSQTYCECPERSPHVSNSVISNKVVSYYPYYRIF